MKTYAKVLLAALVLAALVAVGFLFSMGEETADQLDNTNTANTNSASNTNTTNVNTGQTEEIAVYFPNTETDPNFTNCNTVYPTERDVSVSSSASQSEILEAALGQLFQGPTAAEQQDGFVSVFSADTSGILKNAFIQNQTAYVNLTDIRLLLSTVSTSCGSADFLAEVEATAKQFTGVNRILFAINEDPETFYEWIQIGCSAENDNCDAAPYEAQHSGASATTRVVNMYVVALDDNGKKGELIGCGDSLVAVQREVSVTSSSTQAGIYAALSILLSNKNQTIEDGVYYNALYQSNLDIESVSVTNGVATVRLVGDMALGGVCDGPRFEAQIEQTVLQFEDITSAKIFVNGQTLSEVTSER